MFAVRRATFVAPRQAPRCVRAAIPINRFYSSDAVSPAPAAQESAPVPQEQETTTPDKDSSAPKTTGSKTHQPKPTPKYAKPKAAPPKAAPGPKATPAKAASKPTPPAQNPEPQSNVKMPPVFQARTIAYGVPEEHASTRDVDVDWERSFHGIATRPVTKEQFAVLMKPLSDKDIEVKPDGIIYLPEIKYRRRLNEAFGPMGWGMIPRGEPVVGDNIVTREYALIVDGRFVSQAQGENSYFSAEQLPSAVEGCKSNALMRCCKDLGIGSELWDPQFVRAFRKTKMEEVWVEHMTTKKKRTLWFKSGNVEVVYPWRRA